MADPREDARRALAEAADDRVSGAAEIARRAAEAMAALPHADLLRAARGLVRAHPAMAPLWRLGTDVLRETDHAEAARQFARRVAAERDAVTAAARDVLPDRVVTLSFSGTLAAALARVNTVVCARSEPGGEGARLAARLSEAGADAVLVEDREALELAGSGTAVVVGADAVGPGGVVNKVMTTALAEAAGRGGAPALVLAGSSKFVAYDVPAPDPFERTPLDRFTAVVTETGSLSPDYAARLARTFTVDPRIEAA